MAGAVRFELTMPGSEPGALGLLATPQCKLIISMVIRTGFEPVNACVKGM
jgi:hypothetical protein